VRGRCVSVPLPLLTHRRAQCLLVGNGCGARAPRWRSASAPHAPKVRCGAVLTPPCARTSSRIPARATAQRLRTDFHRHCKGSQSVYLRKLVPSRALNPGLECARMRARKADREPHRSALPVREERKRRSNAAPAHRSHSVLTSTHLIRRAAGDPLAQLHPLRHGRNRTRAIGFGHKFVGGRWP